MKTKWAVYKELELIPDSMDIYAPEPPSIGAWFRTFWHRLVEALTISDEPCIWEKTDRTGKTCWCAFDPVTHSSFCFSSETEVLKWLEERYYDKSAPGFIGRSDRIYRPF